MGSWCHRAFVIRHWARPTMPCVVTSKKLALKPAEACYVLHLDSSSFSSARRLLVREYCRDDNAYPILPSSLESLGLNAMTSLRSFEYVNRAWTSLFRD